MTWSDALSPAGRRDIQALVDAAIAAARSALAGAEVFAPIPLIVASNGGVLPLSAAQLIAPGTPAERQAAIAIEALRKVAPAARAAALVTPTRVAGSGQGAGEALEIWAEHREGAALTLLQPFNRSLLGGVVELGALTAYPGELRIWG